MAGEYIYGDIGDANPDAPNGARGYIIVSEGDKFVRLFSPVTLDTLKVRTDAFEALDYQQPAIDVARMVERINANRELRRRYEMFDGGNSADRAVELLTIEVAA